MNGPIAARRHYLTGSVSCFVSSVLATNEINANKLVPCAIYLRPVRSIYFDLSFFPSNIGPFKWILTSVSLYWTALPPFGLFLNVISNGIISVFFLKLETTASSARCTIDQIESRKWSEHSFWCRVSNANRGAVSLISKLSPNLPRWLIRSARWPATELVHIAPTVNHFKVKARFKFGARK